jgi:hypothetical protein
MKKIIFMCFTVILFACEWDELNDYNINADGVLTGYTGTGGYVTIPNSVTVIGEKVEHLFNLMDGIMKPTGYFLRTNSLR